MKHILILFTLSGLMAQKHDRYEKDRWDEAPVRSERMESMVIWRLTDHLELSWNRLRNSSLVIESIGKK